MTYKTMKRLEYLEKHIDDGEFPVTLFLIEKALSQQTKGFCKKCSKRDCKKDGLNHCEICFGVFCDEHSAYLERCKQNYMDEKCFDCYDAYLTENGLF